MTTTTHSGICVCGEPMETVYIAVENTGPAGEIIGPPIDVPFPGHKSSTHHANGSQVLPRTECDSCQNPDVEITDTGYGALTTCSACECHSYFDRGD